MSKYFDNKSMFGEPIIEQHDSHMVMSGVIRPQYKQYVNIDTKYRDEQIATTYSQLASCNITLPQRICNVKSISVKDAEIPMTVYNISLALGNNTFDIWHSNTEKATIVVDDGDYSASTLVANINSKLTAASFSSVTFSVVSNKIKITTNSKNVRVTFTMNDTSLQFNNSLGWFLGFRLPVYEIADHSTLLSECICQVNNIRYLYLVVDEFTRGNQYSFLCNPDIRKNILAKIVLNKTTYPFGSILPANQFNGYLFSDVRQYNGIIDLLRLKVELVNDLGYPVDLNGGDFSFLLEIVRE